MLLQPFAAFPARFGRSFCGFLRLFGRKRGGTAVLFAALAYTIWTEIYRTAKELRHFITYNTFNVLQICPLPGHSDAGRGAGLREAGLGDGGEAQVPVGLPVPDPEKVKYVVRIKFRAH